MAIEPWFLGQDGLGLPLDLAVLQRSLGLKQELDPLLRKQAKLSRYDNLLPALNAARQAAAGLLAGVVVDGVGTPRPQVYLGTLALAWIWPRPGVKASEAKAADKHAIPVAILNDQAFKLLTEAESRALVQHALGAGKGGTSAPPEVFGQLAGGLTGDQIDSTAGADAAADATSTTTSTAGIVGVTALVLGIGGVAAWKLL